MKPVSLTIQGLHSFREEQTIPFEELSDIGLFGIFGPTGSGKSTILDAMTLALFGSVVRATNHTQGILNHAENRVAVSFTFDAGAGLERFRYTVERVFRRGNDTSVVHQSSRFLKTDPTGGVQVLADLKSSVTDCVIDVLGLTEEDFTKAVVLPQGRFAEFLHLTGSQRSRMMERLFGLERYGARLSETLTTREREERQRLEVTEAAQQHLGDASEQALQAAETRVAEATTREQRAVAALTDTAARLKSASEVWQLQVDLSDVMQRESARQDRVDEITQQRTRLTWAERAAQVSPVVERAVTAGAAHELAKSDKDKALLEEETARARQEERLRLAEAARLKRTAAEPGQNEQLLRLHQAADWESELNEHQARLHQVQQADHVARTALAQAQEELNRSKQAYAKAQADVAELSAAVGALVVSPDMRTSVERARVTATEFEQAARRWREDAKQLRLRQTALDQASEQLTSLQTRLDTAKVLHVAVERSLEDLRRGEPVDSTQLTAWSDWLRDLSTVARDWTEAEQALGDAQEHVAEAARELERDRAQEEESERLVAAATRRRDEVMGRLAEAARHQQERAAADLGRLLEEGEPCPVCGSTHHPAPALDVCDDEFVDESVSEATLLAEVNDELNLAGEALQQARVGRARAEANHAVAVDLLTRQSDRLREIQQQWLRLTATYPQLVDGNPTLGMDTRSDTAVQQVRRAADAIHRLQEARQSWVEQVQRAEAQLQEAREGMQAARADVQTAVAVHHQLEKEYEQATTTAAAALQTERSALTELTQSLREIAVTSTDVAEDGVALIMSAYQSLQDRDKAWAQAQDKLKARQVELERLSATLAQASSAVSEREIEVTRQEEERRHLEQWCRDLQTRLQAATGGERVSVVKARIEAERDTLGETERVAVAELKAADEALAQVQSRMAAADAALVLRQQHAIDTARELTAALAKSGFATTAAVEDARLSDDEYQAMVEAVKAYEAQSIQLRMERERLLARLGDRRMTEPEWQALNEAATAAQSELRAADAQLSAAVTERNDVAARHQTWQTLEATRLDLVKRCDQLGHLRQLFRGNAFVEFVAHEQMEQVARDASARLQQLTQYRYALEVASDGGFLMRDDFNGGVRRPVSTLSGGETFLTSLALALALSTHVQLRGRYPLEFFFLDEGFGTLDPELLETVMTSLDRLRFESLTIGVISHVPELRGRMQRRLIVDPPQPGGRGSRVRVERL